MKSHRCSRAITPTESVYNVELLEDFVSQSVSRHKEDPDLYLDFLAVIGVVGAYQAVEHQWLLTFFNLEDEGLETTLKDL